MERKQRVTQSKPEAEAKAKNGTSLFLKTAVFKQNRVLDVRNTLTVCYEHASVSSHYDSIRYKIKGHQNSAIYVRLAYTIER